jgi:hypothetical protein
MTPPHRLQYYILPKDDPLKAVNILRAAAGLDPLTDDDGTTLPQDVSEDCSSDVT